MIHCFLTFFAHTFQRILLCLRRPTGGQMKMPCSLVQRMFLIIMEPKAVVQVLLLLCFAEAWKLVDSPSILLPDTYLRPASMALNDISSRDKGYTYADAVMYSLPIVALYLFIGWRMHESEYTI